MIKVATQRADNRYMEKGGGGPGKEALRDGLH